MAIFYPQVVGRRVAKSSHLCVGNGMGCMSGCLGCLSARRPLSALALIASGSVISWIASVESACRHPAVSPTPEPSTACFRSAAGQRFRSLLVRWSFRLPPLSLLAPFNRDPTSPSQRALSDLPEPITQLELQLSSFVLTHLFGIDS